MLLLRAWLESTRSGFIRSHGEKIGDFHIAEDITQETFLQVYRRLETLKDPSQFPGWLYVIANRCCLKWLRKKRVEVQLIEEIDIAMAERSSYSRHVAAEAGKKVQQQQNANWSKTYWRS